MPSVREIARQAGVSPATVSRVINNRAHVAPELRRRILGAVNRSRYVPRVGLRSTANIALVYTGEPSVGCPFDAALMHGLAGLLDERGYDLLILRLGRVDPTGDDTAELSNLFMRKGIRGAVLRTNTRTREICQRLAAEGFPAVVVGERFEDPAVSYVYSESRIASREAVEHLINLRHRRIAMAVNVVEDSDHADRLAGYHEALRSAGIDADERLIFRAQASRDGGVQLIRRLRALPDRPTAVYVADPMTAVGALGEVHASGLRVPGELSIVGFDDSDLRLMVHPQLTAVCQDAAALGREAFNVLERLIHSTGPVSAIRLALPTTFEVHGSTGPADKGSAA